MHSVTEVERKAGADAPHYPCHRRFECPPREEVTASDVCTYPRLREYTVRRATELRVERQIMTRMENENVASTNHGLAEGRRGTLNGVWRRKGRRIIIRKDFGVLILDSADRPHVVFPSLSKDNNLDHVQARKQTDGVQLVHSMPGCYIRCGPDTSTYSPVSGLLL